MNEKLFENLEWMRRRGSSVILNWGEDTGLWECSWITGGERFTGVSNDPLDAVVVTMMMPRKKALQPAAASSAAPGVEE